MNPRIFFSILVCIGIAAVLLWAASGTDEFGRNHLRAIASAVTISLLRALVMTSCLILVSGLLAVIVEVWSVKLITTGVQAIVDALESVPIYVWVLAGISWAPQQSAVLAVGIFVIAGLPLAFNSLRGVVHQITQETFFKAAIALGASNWQLARNHVLPNILPYLGPLSLHVLGAALAVYGGIGIFGFVNREELDLGVFLLRAKEQAGDSNILLVLVVLAFASVYLALRVSIHWMKPRYYRGR